jgi:DNA-directed RNA polymerase subunit H (RpoH/RPB5)
MQRLFDIKRTQLEMIHDRGFIIPADEKDILHMDVNQFEKYLKTESEKKKISFRKFLSHEYVSATNPNVKMFVFYGAKTNEKKQVSNDLIHEFINIVTALNIPANPKENPTPIYKTAVLIVDDKISSKGQEEISKVKLTKIQIFIESDLTYNPTSHVSTPKHELLSEEETVKKLTELKVDISKLLVIRSGEPISKYYGWDVGSMILVHRDDDYISLLAPSSINYRVVI